MAAIKDTVKKVMQNLVAKRVELAGSNPQEWMEDLFTKKELRHIKFNYLRKGTLGISVDSSAWLYHFSLKKEALLMQLSIKDATIKNIRFCLGGRG